MKITAQQKGFALLFAVLAASILLAIGMSIFNLTLKELLLSSSGRESQFAFYAADTGAECALYWDFKEPTLNGFATSSNSNPASNLDCVDSPGNLQTVNNTNYVTYTGYAVPRASNWAVTQFSLNIPNTSPQYCAIVTVVKDSSSGVEKTIIDSRGYNFPCSNTTDPSRVERQLYITYP